MQRILKNIGISKHKGNMAAVVVFSLLVIVLIVAMLSWTFSMQSTLQRRAERSTAQYTAVSCTTLMSNAVMRDLCEMTAGKDRGILPSDIDGYNNMLQGIRHTVEPLLASALELIGKVIFAVWLVPVWGYRAVCFCEPTTWVICFVFILLAVWRCRSDLQDTCPPDKTPA